MNEIERLKREIETLKQERDSLREENELLSEKAEDIALLGIISEKISLAKTPEEVFSSVLESVCLLKELGYASLLSLKEGCLSVVDDYCEDLECSLKKQCYDIESINSGFISFENAPIPSYLPEKVKGKRAQSALLLPLKERDQGERRFFLFVNYRFRAEYIENISDLLHRITTLADMKLETLSLLDELRRLNLSLEEKVLEKTRQLRESEERFRQIFQESRDGIVLVDAETGHIVDCNPAFEAMTERPLEILRKMTVWQLRPPEKRKEAEKKFHEIRQRGYGGSSELEIMKPDGSRLPIEFLSKVINIGDRRFHLSVVRDLSERHSLLDRLKRRTRQLEIIHSIVTQSQREADLEKALDRIEAALREYLQVDAFMFYEIKGDQLTLHRAYTGVDEWAKEKKKIGVCLCGLAAEKKEMVLSSNILTDYRCSLDECKRAGIKSFVAIPLFVEENLIGLIGIAWKETRDFAEERDFFEALGAGLSVSLQNIKLIEELKQHSQNLELMVRERTEQLQKAVNLMAGREVRMAELKEVIRNLKEQLRAAGLEPEVDDPLGMDDA